MHGLILGIVGALLLAGCPAEPDPGPSDGTTTSGNTAPSTTLPAECASGGLDDYCCQFNSNYCQDTGATVTPETSSTTGSDPVETSTGEEPEGTSTSTSTGTGTSSSSG